MHYKNNTVAMLGEGAWGTAMATLLARNGLTVQLWCHDPAVAKTIRSTRYNERYLPSIHLDEKIIPTHDLATAVAGVRWIFEAIPVRFLRTVLDDCKAYVTSDQCWAVLSKGIEQETLLLPTKIIDDVLAWVPRKGVMVGPSFAHDVARSQITAVVVAGTDDDVTHELLNLLASDFFRPYVSSDLLGVQVGAALKNVITLGMGLLDGIGCADNTKAFLFTRGLCEMAQLASALGGTSQTMYGLAGVGDLVLTALGKHSKNLSAGRQLGKGVSMEELKTKGLLPEGINTLLSLQQIMHEQQLDLPVCKGIYDAIFRHAPARDIMQNLMHRPLESDCV